MKEEETKEALEKDPTPDDIEGCYGCLLMIALIAIGVVTGFVMCHVMK